MKEAIAGLFAAVVVVPMLIVSQFAFASRTWLLDGNFYRSVTADERLYEGWESGAAQGLVRAAAEEGYDLDAAAAETALAASYKDAELARLVSSFVGDTVDRVRNLEVGAQTDLDFRGLKADVRGRLAVFAASYALAVPTGSPASGRDLTVRPAGVDRDRWTALFSAKLEAALDAAPDLVPIEPRPSADRRLPVLRSGSTVGSALNGSIMVLGAVAVLFWFTCSFLARSRWRDRFVWLGSTLGFASFFPVAAGAVLLIGASPLAGAGGTFVAERLSGFVAEAFRSAGSDASRIASVLASALSRVGRSFFVTGLVTAAVAAALSSARFFPLDDEDAETHARG